jgi:hypothetical protein
MISVLHGKGGKEVYSLLEFALNPTKLTRRSGKLTANVRNTGDAVLKNMILIIYSLNEKGHFVRRGEKFIYALMPGQEASACFDVLATSDTRVYFSLSGFKNGDVFFRKDSLPHQIRVEENESSGTLLS